MNAADAKTNQTNLLKYEWIQVSGIVYSIDTLYIHVLAPISLVGLMLNFICLKILNKKEFSLNQLFSYLKLYVVCSSILCFGISFAFICTTNHAFEFTKTYTARFIGCYILIPVVTVTYTFSSILDILITIERLFSFLPQLKFIKAKLKWKPVCSVSLIGSILLNIPFFLALKPTFIGSNESNGYYYIGVGEFSQSYHGQLIIGTSFWLRDVLTFIVDFILNFLLMILFKRHLNKRKLIINKNSRCLDDLTRLATDETNSQAMNSLNNDRSVQMELINKADNSLTLMVIILSFVMFVEHFFVFTSLILYVHSPHLVFFRIVLFSSLIISLKHSSNIIIFGFFNNIFRNVLVDMCSDIFMFKIFS